MTGVLYNCAFIVVGAFAGRILRSFISERITDALISILGLVTLVVAVKISLRFEDIFLVLGCLLVGATLGTALDLEGRLEKFLVSLQNRWAAVFAAPGKAPAKKEVSQAILNTSILYCTGAMAILGPIESALRNDHEILITKGVLDGVFAMTLAAVYGPVLAVTAVPVFIYQGAIALFAAQLQYLNEPSTLNDLGGVGGIVLLMIGLSVLKIKTFKVGNFLPAILLYLVYSGLRSHLA